MSIHGAYKSLLHALAVHARLDAAQLQASEEISIEGTVVVLSEAGNALQCGCSVARLPEHPPLELLRLLLQANTLGSSTQGATLGLLGRSQTLVLAKRVPLDTPAALALRTCQELAAMSLVWGAALSHGLGSARPTAA